ncbi:DEAD-box ATP-dependent RNA helicase CshB [Kurthia zopfii]|uniref:DEAD-box ATP-dependent RNA helicase CshB n=1 Tax=Kurthia zopfii TaxID=1650 RepID=A0A2U3AHS4_9BACL|nr:DEAD/DEAH box helicase [Kurthia zopfii]PWI24103.1 DEAD/DEAH box helicase [Kurthia zopfii]TDR44360.1 ATP-dependent RNA helicase CshB [Kurthia zopfii]STX10034.1 DEAD-box ATP-dependent RNA helicase CshB [Kurthia zopfii]VEI07647.1 DEAD-box ATP-dependent RNA helicase CshB [Kurthia zopfii]GEK32197.1 DEAD-box ATP-dependent RNA helicase CshB [Kurthia zopfii]
MSKYTDYNFQPFLRDAIEKLGFTEPTQIQKEMIPLIQKGKSAIGQSHTGTGKTHSFLIPIVERIRQDKEEVQTVIAVPTRELAQQIFGELAKLIEGSNIQTKLFIGGTDKQRSIDKLKTQPQIVVGTPGRLRDLVNEQALLVHTAQVLVVDEADLAFDMGFIEDIDQFASQMGDNLEMYVFSATVPESLQPFLRKYMASPVHVQMNDKRPVAENLDFYLVPTRSQSKNEKLLEVIKSINPYLSIIFVNTRKQADYVANFLANNGVKAGRIHGDLTPRDRKRMMKQIRELEFQYIVATDLAARGIDIPGISHVINYELPQDLEFFIHRVGRTARAGNKGQAITIFEPSEEDAIARIEKMDISFVMKDIKNNELVDMKDRHTRQKRDGAKKEDDIDRIAKSKVRKPKKVKPGYKRNMRWEMDKIKKKERRKRARSRTKN